MKKLIIITTIFLNLIPILASADEYFFYTGKDYGSESQYNPVSVILNGGFDIFQVRDNRNIFVIPWGRASENVFNSLGHPIDRINNYGWKEFISEEVFPITMDAKNARWWPNYSLHLLGGGVEWSYLCEYFRYHDVPLYGLWAFTTYWAYHFVNEIVENQGNNKESVDAIADIYIFDLAGMLIFSSDSVRRFFSKTMNLADWSLQPTFMAPDGSLENTGQYFSLKYLVPFFDNQHFHIFAYWGLNVIFGLSYKFNNGYAISCGFGARTKKVISMGDGTARETILWVYSGGIFLDMDNSLMMSLVFNINFYHRLQLNVYPGVLRYRDVSPGFWANLSEDGRLMFGITFRYVPGLGYRSPRYYAGN